MLSFLSYTTILIKVSESQILNVTSIDSQAVIRSVGESVDLFITPSDVLQF